MKIESSRNVAEKGHTDGWVGTGPGAYSVHIRGAAGLFDWKRRDAREIRDVLNALDLDDPKCPTETPRDAAELEGIIDQRERAVRELEARLDTARVLLAVAVAQRPTETGGVAEEQNRRLGDALVRRPTETTRRESRDG